jgi:CRP-like cAMP-binding protein
VVWNLAFGAVHAYQLVRLWMAGRAIDLDDTERGIHSRLFDDLSLLDFYTLWSIGTTRPVEGGDVLIEQGTDHLSIILVVDGEVVVTRGRSELARLGPDSTVGERSYITGEPANASVIAGPDGARVHEWDQRKVEALTKLCPQAHDALMRHIGLDLANKL